MNDYYVSRYEVTLNGISMASIDPSILIRDVQYEKPKYKRNLFQMANRQGARPGKVYKDRAAVTIVYEIHEQNIFKRQMICQAINSWAKDGGELQINDRPGQKLVCVCEEKSAVESVRDWTSEMTITFAAYNVPYWQEIVPTVVTVHIDDGTEVDYSEGYTEIPISVPGNAPVAYMSVRIDHPDPPNSFVNLYNTEFPEQPFVIYGCLHDVSNTPPVPSSTYRTFGMTYDEDLILHVYQINHITPGDTYENDGIMQYVKEADDILASCGKKNTIMFRYGTIDPNLNQPYYTALHFTQAECDVTLTVRGLWE